MIAEERMAITWNGGATVAGPSITTDAMECVACESELTILLDKNPFVVLSCSPEGEKELAIGFLVSEGIITSLLDIDLMLHHTGTACIDVKRSYDARNRESHADAPSWAEGRMRTSGCAHGMSARLAYRKQWLTPLAIPCAITPEHITALRRLADSRSEGHRATGCLHHAALVFPSGHTIMREDIGRHNAVDKAIGTAMLAGLDPSEAVLVSSGRLSSEIILKTAATRIPIVVSRAAPTTAAIDAALEFGVTLIGFARGNRFTVYAHPERVIWPEEKQRGTHAPSDRRSSVSVDTNKNTPSPCDTSCIIMEVT